MLLNASSTELPPPEHLAAIGRVFARFDRQDSGNVSFGVEADGRRWFVKTAGDPAVVAGVHSHRERVGLLENAERLASSVRHPALTRFETSLASPWGPMLVYQWADGEHLHARRERRNDPDTAWQRFLSLSVEERVAAAGTLIHLHLALSAAGWVVGDFYDGCLIYDFRHRQIHVCDLDHYRQGAYENEMGRMFGSTRFMAPEEFERGRIIDERTTVFALGRTLAIFLGDFATGVCAAACAEAPEHRYPTVAALAADFAAVAGRLNVPGQ